MWLGAAAAQHSYLRAERILEVSRSLGVQSIHPGYGLAQFVCLVVIDEGVAKKKRLIMAPGVGSLILFVG